MQKQNYVELNLSLEMAESHEPTVGDEDLLLKGSPLSQYLQDIGRDDFESYPMNCESQPEKCDKAISMLKTNNKLGPFCLSQYLKQFFEWFFPKDPCKTMLVTALVTLVDKFEYHVNLIKGYEPIKRSDQIQDQYIAGVIKDKAKFQKEFFKIMPVLIVQISFGIAVTVNIQKLPAVFLILTLFNFIILAYFVFSFVYRFHLLRKSKNCCDRALSATSWFISNIESIIKSLDKCFLLIRECEVIAMGLTFYHPGVPMLKVATKKRGLCKNLRMLVADSCLDCFESLKAIAMKILFHQPENIKHFYIEDSVFNLSIGEIKSTFDKQSYLLDNVLSSDVLKSLICLIKAQSLELFQIIHLLLQKTIESRAICSWEDDVFSLTDVTTILGTDAKKLEYTFKNLEQKYNFTKENEFSEKISVKLPNLAPNKPLLKIKIDCAFLHLKSAVGKMQELEAILNETQSTDDAEDLLVLMKTNSSLCAKVDELMNILKQDLRSVGDCIDDTQILLNSKCSKFEQETQEDGKPPDIHSENFPQSLNRISDKTPIQHEGDLLLECYSEPTKEQNPVDNDTADMLEQEQLKEQAGESRRLVNELKVIFSMKKDPAGLLPFDLLKRNVKRHVDEHMIGEYDTLETANIEKMEPCNYEKKKENTEVEDITDYSAIGKESKNNVSNEKSSCPPANILYDLKMALLTRSQCNVESELILEADTFEFDSDACPDAQELL